MSEIIPITFEELDSLGFRRWNECFTYRGFPAPLYGNYRIDFETRENVYPKGWYIYFEGGRYSPILKHPKSLAEVDNFYHGICDKWLIKDIQP